MTVVLIDDLRSFLDDRPALVARTSADGVALLERHRAGRIEELWLDHDLGGADTIWPVVEVLERAAFVTASERAAFVTASERAAFVTASERAAFVTASERAAFGEQPFDIGTIYVHSANPAGSARVVQVLRRWGYEVRAVPGSPHLRHMPG